jgi:hypothetical protein
VVVVGVGHLIGPDGLPARLRALGYSSGALSAAHTDAERAMSYRDPDRRDRRRA